MTSKEWALVWVAAAVVLVMGIVFINEDLKAAVPSTWSERRIREICREEIGRKK